MASALWNERLTIMQISDSALPEFDQYAASYSELLDDLLRNRFVEDPLHFHRRKWFLIQSILERANLNPAAQRWLDVGCGRGELLEIAGRDFGQALGCDPSAGMIAPSKSFRVEQQRSSTELPFETASVDFVTAVCVFHHVHGEARRLLTKEIMRVLTPGGLCCIIEHNPWNPVTRAIVRRCPVDIEVELLPARETSKLLINAGFQAPATEYFLFFPEKVFSRVGRVEDMLRRIPFGGQYASLAKTPA